MSTNQRTAGDRYLTDLTLSREARMLYLHRTLYSTIERALDRVAVSQDYRDISDAVSYLNDPNPRYHAEAEKLRAWRSKMWEFYEQVVAETTPTSATLPTSMIDVYRRMPPAPVF